MFDFHKRSNGMWLNRVDLVPRISVRNPPSNAQSIHIVTELKRRMSN
jgi:hypothetical protein